MAVITVTTLDDIIDSGDGQISLREALDMANADVGTRDTIVFADGLEGTIRLQAEQGSADSNSDYGSLIYARNVIIDGDNRITISGDTAGNDVTTSYGGVEVTDLSQMAVDSALLADNVAVFRDLGQGANISTAAVFKGLTLTGGVAVETGGNGGAINAGGQDVVVQGSLLIGNQAATRGGAIWGNSGQLVILDSTITGNRAGKTAGDDGGGGISHSTTNFGGLIVVNSTITNNYAEGDGGGISLVYAGGNVVASLVLNSTITGNYSAINGGGIEAEVDMTISNSLVLGNEAGGTNNEVAGNGVSFSGKNLIGENSTDFNASAIAEVDNAALADVFAALQTYGLSGLTGGMLADNGGPIWTVALKDSATNPALDQGADADLNEATLGVDLNADRDTADTLDHDARGGTRSVNNVDIGAFELGSLSPTDLDLSANTVDENDSGGVIGDLTVTGPNGQQATTNYDFTVSDTRFEVVNGQLKLKDGEALDYEQETQVSVDVTVTGPDDNDYTETFNLTVNDINEAPTLSLANIVFALAENTDTTSRRKVADIVITDDALGTNNLSLSGTDASFFEIDGTELYLKANTSLDYESKTQFDVTINVDDPDVGTTPDATTTYSLQVTDVAENAAPTAVGLTNITSALAEDADTTSRVKVADIVVTDDGLGTNTLGLSGADSSDFEIIGTTLYLKAITSLDYESKTQFDVTIEVDDTSIGATPDASTTYSLQITDVAENAAPTAVGLTNITSALAEDTDTTSRVKVADIVVTDDGIGTNTLGLSGADSSDFEIIGTTLYLKAGTALDYESKTQFDVTIEVDDTSIGATPDASTTYSLQITDVAENAAPTAVGLTNITSALAEDADTTSRVKVADIVVTDDGLGTNTLGLSGADSSDFEIIGTTLYLKAGTTLDYESKTQFDVAIEVDDTGIGATPDASTTFSLQITDVGENTPPTAVSLTNITSALAEDTDTTSRVKIADIVVTDDGLGTNTLGLSGADSSDFEIIGTTLYLKAGTSLDHESKTQFDVTIEVDDTSIGATPDASTTFSLQIKDVGENAAPTAVSLTNITSALAEDTDTTSRVKVADIVVTDDGLGTNTLGLSGVDSSDFEIIGTTLFLKAGTTLDYESKTQFDVAIEVDDTSVGATPDASTTFSLQITDVGENTPPTTVSLTNITSALAEDTDTTSRVKIADIVVTDDSLGTNTFGLSGADAGSFEIIGTVLYLKAGTTLDYESKTQFDVTIEVDDTSVGETPDASTTFSFQITDVGENAAPMAVSLTNITSALAEDTDTTSRVKIADIVVTDDGLGTNTFGLSGADAGSFEIIGTVLYLRAGTSLDYESKTQFDVTIEVDDTSVGATPDASTTFSLQITDVAENTPPTAVGLTNITSALAEDTDTTSRVKVADIIVTDDGLGTNTLGLSGADSSDFEIIGTELFLKAGTSLDYESKTQFDVTIEVNDTSVGATPDASTTFSLQITDVAENAGPTAVGLTNITSALAEDTDTTSRVKVADIVVTDDGLGTNTLGLSGADSSDFEIIATELYLKAGTSLDYESKTQFDVTIEVDDTSIGATPDASTTFSLQITDVAENTPPTAVSLTNITSALTEDTDTTSRVKVADIVVTDDGLGINTLGLSGADSSDFEIIGTTLYLRSGTTLDYEIKTQFDVTIEVDDTSVGSTPDASTTFTLQITDVGENAAPTAVSLRNITSALAEDTDTSSRVKVADIVVTDDGLGSNMLGLSGADSSDFEIIGTTLYLKAGTTLNSETKTEFDVTIEVDDTSVGTTPDASTSFSLRIVDDVNLLTQEQRTELIKLYIAFFNRAPEFQGLEFHSKKVREDMEAGASFQEALTNRANVFFEAGLAFPSSGYSLSQTLEEFVETMYANVVLRPGAGGNAPTQSEISYWVARLTPDPAIGVPEITRGQMAQEMLTAVDILINRGTPEEIAISEQVQAALNNRVVVAEAFAQSEISGHLTGDAAVQAGIAALVGVTSDPATIQPAIDAFTNPPQTLNFSQEEDELRGGNSDDLLEAIGPGDDVITGHAGEDFIEGGAGADIMTGDGRDVGSFADIFFYQEADSSRQNNASVDTITDFETGVDNLQFLAGPDLPLANGVIDFLGNFETEAEAIAAIDANIGGDAGAAYITGAGRLLLDVEADGWDPLGDFDMTFNMNMIQSMQQDDFLFA